MSATDLLAFEGIGKQFGGVTVLRDITLSLPPGRTLGLVGENGAGKSTLMNVLGGNLQPDAGCMRWEGRPYGPRHPQDAARAGVSFIHQELNLFPNLSIAENIFVADFPTRAGGLRIDRADMRRRTAAALAEVGLAAAPSTPIERLSAGERQLVEIARALSRDSRLIILDEPTTSLSHRERELLFGLLRRLQARGLAMIYISHRLEEVRALAHTVAVLRDGALVAAGPAAAYPDDRLIPLMVGRTLNQLFPSRHGAPTAEPMLEVRGLCRRHIVRDISFTVHRGEVLGVAGLLGAGRSEMARLVFGLDQPDRGEIRLAGRPVTRLSARRRIAQGLAFLTEDRRSEGLCPEASIDENLLLAALPRYSAGPMGWIQTARRRDAIARIRQTVGLTASARGSQAVATLSGGNQQKVVLAKWLLAKPRALLLDEPTRGIDVGAKAEIYRLILEWADAGIAVLMISSEIEELMGLCDGILVMRQGEIVERVPRRAFDRERLLQAALTGNSPAASRDSAP